MTQRPTTSNARRPLALLALSALCALALAAGCAADRGKRFQHVTHAGQGLACKSCHDNVFAKRADPTPAQIASDTPPKPALYPSDDKCVRCHKDPHPGKTFVGACARCHGNAARDVKNPDGPSHIIFSHPKHEPRAKGQCIPCHAKVAHKAESFGRLTPAMETCTNSCHKKDMAEMACSKCHARLDVFPIKPVGQFAHAGDFLRNHGRLASSRVDFCTQCHTQPFCVTCHDPRQSKKLDVRWPTEIEKSFIHRGDYVGRHSIEARSSGDLCVRCHSVKECNGCHEQRGFAQGGGRSPHPPGWFSLTGGSNLHGAAARREIVTCAGCHDQGAASNCVKCHRVGGVGGNPHPPGFKSRQSKTRDAVCRVCH